MSPVPLHDPFADVPPDKASATLLTQQIVQQHLILNGPGLNPENYEFDSDVDSRLSGWHVCGNTLAILDNWTRPMPQCGGMDMSTLGVVGSADPEVCPTPSLSSGYSDSDHSTIELPSPPSNFDEWGPEADEYKEDELFCQVEETHTALGSPNEAFLGLEVDFGTQDTFPDAPSFPYPSSGYGPPLWQYKNGPATADVHCPPLSHGYPIAGSFPAIGAAQFMVKSHPEQKLSHVDLGAPWLCRGNGRRENLSPDAPCTINPSLLHIPYPCLQVPLYGQEQLQEHHYGVAPAGALGLGSGMQVSGYQDEVETLLPSSGPCPKLVATGPRKYANNAHKGVPSEKPATSTDKKKRTQSTEKVYSCNWPGCLKAFARTNNLKVHRNGVHHKRRDHVCPVAGCPKAEPNKGFSRKFDLSTHWRKHHLDGCEGMTAA